MTPKNDFPVQYDRNMTDADICRDLYARSFMYSALIQMLVERLELGDEGRDDKIEEAETLVDEMRAELSIHEENAREKDDRILELEKENDELNDENDGLRTRIDDLESQIRDLEQEDD